MAEKKESSMESKEENKASEAPLLTTVARWFKDQAFMCSKDEGLEVVFGAAFFSGSRDAGDPRRSGSMILWRSIRARSPRMP